MVIGCSNRSDRDKHVTFHRIPAVTSHYGEREFELSVKRRAAFLAAISREDVDVNNMDKYRICSRHFVHHKPAKTLDETNIDWVPTLHLGHKKRQKHSPTFQLERFERARRRNEYQQQQEEQKAAFLATVESVGGEITAGIVSELVEEIASHVVEDFVVEAAAMEAVAERIIREEIAIVDIIKEEIELAMVSFVEGKCGHADEVTTLKKELQRCQLIIQELSTKLEQHLPPFSEESLKDDSSVNFYTGLPNLKILKAIFDHVCITLPGERTSQCKLTKFQEFMLVMLKLRLSSPIVDLAYRFDVSPATVSRLLLKWLTQMDIRLKSLIIWPEREDLQKTMPKCFQVSFGKKVAIIIDCFEIFLERPSNLQARASTWSNYKHRNTAKVLLGIVPQGAIAFVSETWGGRVSDKHLTEHSGILKKLLPGDIVLADRGFDIAESVGMMQASLHIPAFTKGKNQLSPVEVEETRTIANVRIHVERVIGMVRQKYSILHSTIPIDFVTKRAGEDVPLIDRIVRVCCALSNVCNPIVPFD